MSRGKVIAVGIGGVAVIVLAVVLAGAGGTRNISGTYELYAAGKDTGTVVLVTERGGKYMFDMKGADALEASFIVPKSRDNQYLLESAVNGKATARYRVTASGKGLAGKATILPVGDITVLFKKVK